MGGQAGAPIHFFSITPVGSDHSSKLLDTDSYLVSMADEIICRLPTRAPVMMAAMTAYSIDVAPRSSVQKFANKTRIRYPDVSIVSIPTKAVPASRMLSIPGRP